MKKIISVIVSIALVALPVLSVAKPLTLDSLTEQKSLALSIAPIKTKADLLAYQKLNSLSTTPLKYLSKVDRQVFLDSLTYNEKGLTGFNYSVLARNLTSDQVNSVLALFGNQHLTKQIFATSPASPSTALIAAPAEDHIGYRCAARASCYKNADFICTSNC